jgi:CRP-like cAMP-binding protein
LLKPKRSPANKKTVKFERETPPANQILKALPQAAFETLARSLERIQLQRGDTLFEPGDPVTHAHFPLESTVVALILPMRDGRTVEATTIGREGAVGGIVSLGSAPAFTRASVQIPGYAARVPLARLEAVKRAAPKLHDILSRYADCLTAQVFQSVGCATVHPLEARCARWLLMTHDRLQKADLPLTQEMLAEMFGVARTYVTRIAGALQARGAISYRRGVVRILRRSMLEETTCECYWLVRRHFDRVLPGLYPSVEP